MLYEVITDLLIELVLGDHPVGVRTEELEQGEHLRFHFLDRATLSQFETVAIKFDVFETENHAVFQVP